MAISSAESKLFTSFKLCPKGFALASLQLGDEWEEKTDLGEPYKPSLGSPSHVRLGKFFLDGEEFYVRQELPVDELLASRVGSWMIPTDTMGGYTIESNLPSARQAILRMAQKIDKITNGGGDIYIEAWRLNAKAVVRGEVDSWSISTYEFYLFRPNIRFSRVTASLCQ